MQRFLFDEVDVLVVGGGAAGLATGLTLGEMSISALVVERRLDMSTHPRATALTVATMELMRGWGIEPLVRLAGFVTLPVLSLRSCFVGPELDRIPMREHVWQVAEIFERASGRQAKKRHIPLPMMRVMSILMQPLNPAISRLIRNGIYMDTANLRFDAADTARAFGIQLTSLAEIAGRVTTNSVQLVTMDSFK